MVKLSKYILSNKKTITKNWRQDFIKAKHGYSLQQYLFSIREHIENDLSLDMDCDIAEIESQVSPEEFSWLKSHIGKIKMTVKGKDA